MSPENKMEHNYCDWLRNHFDLIALSLKLVLFTGNGFPDRTILCKGQVFFIEFKMPYNRLQPNQVLWKKRLEKLGFKVYVCTSLEQAKRKTIKHLASA